MPAYCWCNLRPLADDTGISSTSLKLWKMFLAFSGVLPALQMFGLPSRHIHAGMRSVQSMTADRDISVDTEAVSATRD